MPQNKYAVEDLAEATVNVFVASWAGVNNNFHSRSSVPQNASLWLVHSRRGIGYL